MMKYKVYRRAISPKGIRFAIAFSLGLVLCVAANIFVTAKASYSQQLPTNVADIRPDEAAAVAYQQFTQFPLENQYISRETSQVANDNTLIERLIRYHQYVKDRPLNYRLDWKLTLADYLGANELIPPDRYPGNTTLTQNPLKGDRAVIESLSREQRNQLVATLVSIYNPQAQNTDNNTPTASPTTPENTNQPKFPQRGNADLLLP
ncbi:hypothetical protein [Myxosarcina sp. GI1]|uniref:hypothetical protein n=1 Tax=Myxosarcina sp. GI1 TaxID=1541065 RepID=UPI00068A4CFB|nr:hypothetical protein [Myxosarcina sp. GI1]